jgi:AcrR family transcriptional regulator
LNWEYCQFWEICQYWFVPSRRGQTRGFKKRERTRGQLLDAAMRVLAEKGEAFSVSDVVARAGVSNGTFYNYFVDREELLGALAPRLAEAFAADSAAVAPRGDAALRVATITARVLLRAVADPTRARALLRLEVPRALAGQGASAYLREDLADGLAQGRFEVGPEDAVIDLVAGVLLMGIRRIVEGRAAPGYLETVLARLLRALGVPADEVAPLAGRALAAARELDPDRAAVPRLAE